MPSAPVHWRHCQKIHQVNVLVQVLQFRFANTRPEICFCIIVCVCVCVLGFFSFVFVFFVFGVCVVKILLIARLN